MKFYVRKIYEYKNTLITKSLQRQHTITYVKHVCRTYVDAVLIISVRLINTLVQARDKGSQRLHVLAHE